MKLILKLEEWGFFILSLYLFLLLDYSWWVFPLLMFAPDISILAYAINNKIGAIIYNIFHHRGLSIALYIAGTFLGNQLIQLIGIMLFAHSTIDRILGYGLKYLDSFGSTHLGNITNVKPENP
ncbi:MAG TPA: DUF4260 domain-containing protein [Ignavibacteriaceae bacterium]|nr:DUF4260 domain-containing protein [Ignavibacteriaceae bacterium]